MENITQSQLKAFEQFMAELHQTMQPYYEERKMIFSNRQLFAFTMNLPFIFGTIADGKQTLKEAIQRSLIDSEWYIHPENLPEVFDYIEDPENHITDKKFNETLHLEELHIIGHFAQFEEVLLKLLTLYTEKSKCLDKYGIISKINLITNKKLQASDISSLNSWAFLKQLNVVPEKFVESNYKLTQDEWNKMYRLPGLVLYLVASADQSIDKKEMKTFIKYLQEEIQDPNPLIQHIYENALKNFEGEKVSFSIGKHTEIIDELKSISELASEKLSECDASGLLMNILKLGYKIAGASGFWGFSFVAYQEAIRIDELAKTFGFSNLDGKKIKFGKKVKYNKKEYKPKVFLKIFYATTIVHALIKALDEK